MLNSYLPYFLQDVRELKTINEAEQVELDKLNNLIKATLNNQFIDTANEYGISRWEKMLKINPKDADSLDDRRFRILVKLSEQAPYTAASLKNQLETICGLGGFVLEIKHSNFEVNVKVELTAKSKFNDVNELLRTICPANMVINTSLRYNTWDDIKNSDWDSLGATTWDKLREEVIR
ncbi:MAG: putative phage tail protein [Anaerovoracaceae bacterium]